jgi:dipeptidyl aminopeptidase/acylaminoacyl peptidase
LRSTGSPPATRKAALTVITTGPLPARPTRISVVGPAGRLRTVWHCPGPAFCGELTSIAWSPDGRRLALTLGEIGGRSGFIGLHVIDVATGKDHQLGVPRLPQLDRAQPTAVLDRLFRAATKHLGCGLPHQVVWSPDSRRLAYVCGDDFLRSGTATTLYVICADGTGRIRVPTRTRGAYWPSWSPDGARLGPGTASTSSSRTAQASIAPLPRAAPASSVSAGPPGRP